ncbi:endo-1,4-beta-xylanase [Maribellus maritimus]|uniref:endo-1,4-beta-xylanase n=1 Tax=Maribellus maritimus TaxID=2870838 RepID=UPI001EEB5D8D|nr:endo-1,4-beta-xylanase [Maribellus maritimus]MCG6186831.1 endo-1,4-beta-xylanase [Maribellus maritimus]
MKKLSILLFVFVFVAGCGYSTKKQSAKQEKPVANTFKEVFKDDFYVGAALNKYQIMGADSQSIAIVEKQFNSITPENYMKASNIHPEKDRYDFRVADKYVAFGLANNMKIIGHTLVWHIQLPEWFFVDDEGNQIGRDELIARMKEHITTVVSRYKGKVKGWDVVNEALNEDGSYRESKFYEILGKDYIRLAFQFAHEADPDAELYYNDYTMYKPKKRDAVVQIIKELKAEGVRIDGIGMQAHYILSEKDSIFGNIEKSIMAFAGAGVKVMVTELDISVLPFPDENQGADISGNAEYNKLLNPYTEGLPEDVRLRADNYYIDLFNLFVKYSDTIDRVTFWGVTDNQSWKNNWPVKGRTDYPLLFDRNYQAKPVVNRILKIVKD